LETLLGEQISRVRQATAKKSKETKGKKKTSGMRSVLKNFILTRVLSDPETLRKYTKGRCGTPSGRFEKKYQTELRALILTRLLILVVFLDKAKTANVLDGANCLFVAESKIKSTSDMLIKLCTECLSAEGSIIKHLSRIGVNVSCKQKPIDELDFTVSNLAANIRDGVLLTRLAEILSNAPRNTLLQKLRIPAVSRFQKLHNVGFALAHFEEIGVHNTYELAAHHIVDGYREQVLQLLWAIASQCGISYILDCKIVEDEIKRVESSKLSYKWYLVNSNKSCTLQAVDMNEDYTVNHKTKTALIRWSSAVASKFGTKVYDLTQSFDDGVVLCLLIHYYHPHLLRLDDIKPTTRHGLCGNEAIINERHNIRLALNRMSEIGGMPKVLEYCGARYKAEEKSMFLCLAYLCSRLIESSTEIHASISIQRWYRRRKRLELTMEKIIAAKKIWRAWTTNKNAFYAAQKAKFGKSVEIIERFVLARMGKIRQLLCDRRILESHATLIQAYVRRHQAKKRFAYLQKLISSILAIQRFWKLRNFKMSLTRSIQRKKAAIKVQTAWRRYSCEDTYARSMFLIIKLQARTRRFLARLGTRRWNDSATNIQRIWRGFNCQILYQVDRIDVIMTQSIVRRFIAVKKFQRSLSALIVLQCFMRRVTAKKVFNNLVITTITAQMRGATATQLLKLLSQAREQSNQERW